MLPRPAALTFDIVSVDCSAGAAMDWDEFIRVNNKKLAANYGYERVFVHRILRRVPGLNPSNVTLQAEFRDQFGKRRRADFLISKGNIRLAIEVDGWDEDGSGRGPQREQLEDDTVRRVAMAREGWTLVQFSNRQVRDRADWVIESISDLLQPHPQPEPPAISRDSVSTRRRQPVMLAVAVVAIALTAGVFALRSRGTEPAPPWCRDAVSWEQASTVLGEDAVIRGPVAGVNYRPDVSGAPTFINIGDTDPPGFVALLWGSDRDRFAQQPDESLTGTTVCVRGRVTEYDGIPQIVLKTASQLSVSRH